MLQLELWLFIFLGQFNINFYTDCTLVKQEKNLIEFACISVTGESFPVVIEYQETEDRSIPVRARSKSR